MKRIVKRIFCFTLSLCLATLVGVPIISAETEGPFQYYAGENEATIFKCDPSVKGHLDIPETLGGLPVKAITNQAFFGCLDLTSVTIPSGIHSLYGSAFAFSGLTTVTIPKTVMNIGDAAFEECYSLTEIIVEEGNPNYISVDGVLFTKDLTKVMQYPCAKKDSYYSVPQGVKTIDEWSFAVNPYLKKVVLSDTVTTIEEFAFHVCENLTDVTVPASVKQIDRGAFGWTLQDVTRLPVEGFIMHGYAGTAAEYYCLEYEAYGFTLDLLNQKGDNNHDNLVNAKDAMIALQVAVKKGNVTPGLLQVSDVTANTLVNAQDALEILKKAVGKPSCF